MDDLNWDPELNPESADVAGSPIVKDSQTNAIEKLASELGMKLNTNTKDYLYQYYLNEQSSKNAWNREMLASSTQYQRAVADLKAAGLNPFLALQSLSGSSANSSTGSISGGLLTQTANSKRENTGNIAKGIMSVIAIIAAAVIGAML